MINEVVIKLVDRLDIKYGNDINLQEVKSMIESVLYDYEISPKETLPSIIEVVNLQNKIMLYLAVKKIEGLSKNTLKQYGLVLRKFSYMINKNVTDITTMDIRMYLISLSKENLSNITIGNYTNVIRGFFSWLEIENYILDNPMKKIKTIKKEKRLKEALTKEDFEILRTGAQTLRQKALLETMYSTGTRLEEIQNMKIADIDWQRLQLQVIGKGDKERAVYLNAAAQVYLKKYLTSRDDDCEYLFVTMRNPIHKMGQRAIQKEIGKIAQQSGLNKHVHCHKIRRTAATHWLNAGMDITVVQAILGHDNLSTTQIYAKIDDKTVEYEYKKYA